MAATKPQTPSELSLQYSTRMVTAFRYASLTVAGIGLIQAAAFALIGSWSVVAMELVVFVTGVVIYGLIRRGHLAFGILAGQAALMLIAIIISLFLDVPRAETTRVSHIYLLVIAALGYINYQRQKSLAQLALIVLCLLSFIVLASAPLTSPLIVVPDLAHTIGTWANAITATAMLAACILSMQSEFTRKDKYSRDLTAALWKGEFQLVYQPQVDVSQNTVGAEALLRWNSKQRGSVSPLEFIPLAEKLGLMIAIGGWVLERGCWTLAEWAKTAHFRHLTLSINISASQLMHEDFESFVSDTLIKTGADPQRLILELTESVLITDIELVIAKLNALRALGITIALDDFGTGYSSLSYLRRLPIQQIKIDRSFVQDALNSSASASLVKNIVLMGQELGRNVLAEGVETRAQHDLLRQFGCVEFQGYLYGRPMDLTDFEQRVVVRSQ